MVKNTKGGSSHKKFARKFATAKASSKLRTAEEEGELYAIVTALNGNNMFTCHCIDGENRLGRIRGKFAGGRGKRNNLLLLGTWVLVGLREWDIGTETNTKSSSIVTTKKQKLQECDLLEVYTESDKCQLIDSEDEPWERLISNDRSRTTDNSSSACDIEFMSEKDIEREELIKKMNSETEQKISMNKSLEDNNDEVEVDFNDI